MCISHYAAKKDLTLLLEELRDTVVCVCVWKNLPGLHRGLTSSPSNTFVMDQLRARPHRSASVLDLTNALMAEWEQIPARF